MSPNFSFAYSMYIHVFQYNSKAYGCTSMGVWYSIGDEDSLTQVNSSLETELRTEHEKWKQSEMETQGD